jgi:hypothetical protein
MQVSRSPIASWISTAATELSTPPERPQITRPASPTCSRMRSIASCLKAAMVQSPAQPQTTCTKLERSRAPSGVCTTSGWNCTPYIRFSSFAMAA